MYSLISLWRIQSAQFAAGTRSQWFRCVIDLGIAWYVGATLQLVDVVMIQASTWPWSGLAAILHTTALAVYIYVLTCLAWLNNQYTICIREHSSISGKYYNRGRCYPSGQVTRRVYFGLLYSTFRYSQYLYIFHFGLVHHFSGRLQSVFVTWRIIIE